MLPWSTRRKVLFFGGVIVLLLAILGGYGSFRYYRAPSCTNGKQDGGERGVDCGGKCARLCRADAALPAIHFVRALPIEEGLWVAVAYGENKNTGAGARSVPYLFKFYDAKNLLVYERHGTAFIPPRSVFAIFEGRMPTGSRLPTRATFEFTDVPVFEKLTQPELAVDTKEFKADEHGSSLQAVVTNSARDTVSGIELVALLFGTDGNVIGASSTFIRELTGGKSVGLTFTWPKTLQQPARTEVLYTIPGRN